jgi:hypothetical protein
MKKLSLELEALRVETFATTAAVPARGTVQGLEDGASVAPTVGNPPATTTTQDFESATNPRMCCL